uniref:Uncharacterized protein n=1 Tax=Brugia timori TaxID=42155 RepID=A0A0R3QEW0_9BILA
MVKLQNTEQALAEHPKLDDLMLVILLYYLLLN